MIPLMSLGYLPPLSWCSVAWKAETVALEACDHYQKGTQRNGCYLVGANGIQRLVIPLVKGKNQQTPIREVGISYDLPWQRQHWRSIKTAYGNAPFFEHYAGDIAGFYERHYSFLFDFNLELLQFIWQKKLGWKGRFILTEQYYPKNEWPQGADFRDTFTGDYSQFPDWYLPQPYPQVFSERSGFIPNLSILDALFCLGKESVNRFRG